MLDFYGGKAVEELVISLFNKMTTDDRLDVKDYVKLRGIEWSFDEIKLEQEAQLLEIQCQYISGNHPKFSPQFFLGMKPVELPKTKHIDPYDIYLKHTTAEVRKQYPSRYEVTALSAFNTVDGAAHYLQFLRTAIALRRRDYIEESWTGTYAP